MSRTVFSGPIQVGAGSSATSATSSPEIDFVATTIGPGSGVAAPTKYLVVKGVANAAAANTVTVQNASYGQATTITFPDPGTATAFVALDPSASVANAPGAIVRIITAGQAALASAGKVVVQAHTSATSQFAVMDVKVLKSTGLSGNSGDRLLALSDGTIVYNNAGITAALLGTPITTVWGGTGNPLPASTVDPSASTAGADIYLQYAGGTADYNAGSVKIAVTLVQVTQ